jgi:hypothetical protein
MLSKEVGLRVSKKRYAAGKWLFLAYRFVQKNKPQRDSLYLSVSNTAKKALDKNDQQ